MATSPASPTKFFICDPNARPGHRFRCRNLTITEIEQVDLTDCSGLHDLILGPLNKTGRSDVAKKQKTVWQLAEMIAGKIGVSGVSVRVREDHADGWCPSIVSAPSNELGFQRRADEIARQLRFAFDLAR